MRGFGHARVTLQAGRRSLGLRRSAVGSSPAPQRGIDPPGAFVTGRADGLVLAGCSLMEAVWSTPPGSRTPDLRERRPCGGGGAGGGGGDLAAGGDVV